MRKEGRCTFKVQKDQSRNVSSCAVHFAHLARVFRHHLPLERRVWQRRSETLNALITVTSNKKKSWPESASKQYRPSDRRMSVKLVPTFADRGCQVVSVTDPYDRILEFLDRSRIFSFKQLLNCTHEAEWTSFQTHYFLENLVAPGIEPGTLDL
jgi:hypothetical protein